MIWNDCAENDFNLQCFETSAALFSFAETLHTSGDAFEPATFTRPPNRKAKWGDLAAWTSPKWASEHGENHPRKPKNPEFCWNFWSLSNLDVIYQNFPRCFLGFGQKVLAMLDVFKCFQHPSSFRHKKKGTKLLNLSGGLGKSFGVKQRRTAIAMDSPQTQAEDARVKIERSRMGTLNSEGEIPSLFVPCGIMHDWRQNGTCFETREYSAPARKRQNQEDMAQKPMNKNATSAICLMLHAVIHHTALIKAFTSPCPSITINSERRANVTRGLQHWKCLITCKDDPNQSKSIQITSHISSSLHMTVPPVPSHPLR